MSINHKQLVKDYQEAFGNEASLPIAFWHSDTPVAEPETVNGCFFQAFENVRNGKAASFDASTMSCGGGKFYCGLAPMPPYVPTFVSEKEHYKARAELVESAISQMEIEVNPHKFINFQRIDHIDRIVDYHGVLIFATPDVMSGLVSWAYYDNASRDAVAVPWGSGCSATIRAVMRENDLQGRQCFIGLFDPSVRTRIRADEMMFAIPKSRLEEMITFLHDTCLFNGAAWGKVKERINK